MHWNDTKGIEDIPSTVVVPETLLYDCQSVREYVNTKLLPRRWHSVKEIKKAILSNKEALIKMDRSFWMEIAFVEEHFEGMIEHHCKTNALVRSS